MRQLSSTKLLSLGRACASTFCARLLATVPLSLWAGGEKKTPICYAHRGGEKMYGMMRRGLLYIDAKEADDAEDADNLLACDDEVGVLVGVVRPCQKSVGVIE